jgi:hypothetical protein
MVSVVLWVARRRAGVPAGATAVPYAREQAPMLLVVLFVMALETVGVEVLLRALGVPSWLRVAVLVIDVSGVVLGLGFAAACVTRPHVVTPDELRIRLGAYFDLRVPRDQISSVRLSRAYNENRTIDLADGRLGVAVSAQTNVVVELTGPITVRRPLGGLGRASTIRFFADAPGPVVTALREPAPS